MTNHMRKIMLISAAICALPMLQCKEKSQTTDKKIVPKNQKKQQVSPQQDKQINEQAIHGNQGLLLAISQFEDVVDASGKKRPKPGPAKLMLLAQDKHGWQASKLEDGDSNVFHKAQCMSLFGKNGILTIGAMGAHLKHWIPSSAGWKSTTYWQPKFGGKFDRLRDYELGDVDADGQTEIVIATHDQGVIAVAQIADNKIEPTEVYRTADTFIHEIEIGDVNGDGKLEFYATPSKPNKAGASQAGGVMQFRFRAKQNTYQKRLVVKYSKRHAKEILVADMNNDGQDELYVSVEAELSKKNGKLQVDAPLEIIRYEARKKGKWKAHSIAKLEGGIQARVLLPADLDGDKTMEMVVTTMKGGVWRLIPSKDLKSWKKSAIDADSSGFEHAAGIADFDHNGIHELYVVSDDNDSLSQYEYKNGKFKKTVIFTLPKRDITWNIAACETIP